METPLLNIVSNAKGKKFKLSPWLALAVVIVIASLMSHHTRLFVLLMLLATLSHTLFLSGLAIGGLLAGVPIQGFRMFFGPELVSGYIGEAKIGIGCIPLGGYVQVKGMGAVTEGEISAADDFRELSRLRRLSIFITGPVLLLVLASLCIGPVGVGNSFVRAFYQYVAGSIQPLTQGQILLDKLAELLKTGNWPLALGIIASKMAALSLFPLGGNTTNSLLDQVNEDDTRESVFYKGYRRAGTIVIIILSLGWLIAGTVYLYHIVLGNQ